MSFEELKPWMEKRAALQHALGLLSLDRSCTPLPKARANMGATVNVLNKELLNLNQSPELAQLLKQCSKEASLNFEQRRIVEEWKQEIEKAKAIPMVLNLAYRQAVMQGANLWPTCKQNNDWKSFEPALKEVIRLRREVAQCQRKEGQSLYDVLLEEYLPGFNTQILDEFFDLFKAKIVPLLQKIKQQPAPQDDFLHQPFEIEQQKKVVKELIARLGFDFESGAILESEHPFTTHFHNHDVRFTNHYHPDNLHAIFSAIHETGHALYEMGIRDDLSRTPVGTGTSTPMHEGQSRFYENMLGRNPLFWQSEYAGLQQAFPKQLSHVSLNQFLAAINKVQPGLIRIMADELTYSLHILVRYELEKEIINNNLDIAELPALWNQKIKEVLGVDVPNDEMGVLQDMHWGSGMFGYFAGYSLGSAVAAQLYAAMKKAIDVETLIRNQDYAAIRRYLQENIHQYGKLYTTDELLEKVTQEKFNPQYYVDYLVEKFSEIYGL